MPLLAGHHHPEPEHLRDIVARLDPDVNVLESSRFPACCPDMRNVFPIDHVIVVGPYPDDTYRDAALSAGAEAWISRDRLPMEVIHELCRVTEMATCMCGCQDGSPIPKSQVTD